MVKKNLTTYYGTGKQRSHKKQRYMIFHEDQTLGDSDEQPGGDEKGFNPLALDDEEQ